MGATKNGNYINVTGTGNTLASITSDINDTTFIEETSTDYYVLKGNTTRIISILPNAELIIGDPSDPTVSETLMMDNPSSNRTGFKIQGSLQVYGQTTIETVQANTYPRSNIIHTGGEVILSGSAGYPVRMNNYGKMSYYDGTTGSYTHTHFGKTQRSLPFATFDAATTTISDVLWTARNCHWGIDSGSQYQYQRSNPVWMGNTRHDWGGHICTFIDCTVANANYGPNFYGLLAFKMISGSVSNHINSGYNGSQDVGPQSYYYQHFKDVRFNNDYNQIQYIVNRNNSEKLRLLFEHCYFDNSNSSGLFRYKTSPPPGRLMIIDPQFADPTYERYANYISEYVNRLTVNVVDANNQPMGDATITLTQKDGYETYTQNTEEDGYLDLFGQPCFFCTHYTKKGNYPNFTVVYKSDDSNSTYHTITATKSGFVGVEQKVVMDSDRSLTIKMLPAYNAHVNYSKYNEIL